MVFPYPAGIVQGDDIWPQLVKNSGWRLVEITERSVSRRGDVAVLAYRVRAEKPDAPIHDALCASTWLDDGGSWLQLSHQQTPV